MTATCNPLSKPLQPARMAVAKRDKKPLSDVDKRKRARTFFYLKLWDNIYAKWGWVNKSQAEKDELRHGINEDLFGRYIAPSKLSNEQFTIMRFALELLFADGVLIWSKEMAAFAVEEGLRRIYTYWIDNAGLDIDGITEYGAPEDCIAAIAHDRFHGVADWHTLNSHNLWQLFITIKKRVRDAHKKGVSLFKRTIREDELIATNPSEESGDPF